VPAESAKHDSCFELKYFSGVNPELAITTLLGKYSPSGIKSPCVVGISGGVDSTVLLVAAESAGVPIIAAHVNYGLRNSESNENQQFCEELCARLQVPLYTMRLLPEQIEELKTDNIQNAARKIRYDFLEQVRRENGCEFILTAHHFDDQVETVIYRLLRGWGLKTLHGIRSVHGKILRPLLHLEKKDLIEYANQHKLNWSSDSSNHTDDYDRNKIRNQLLPLLYEVVPHQHHGLKRGVQIISTESEIIEEWLREREQEWIEKRHDVYIIKEACLTGGEKGVYFLSHFLAPFGFSFAQCELIPKLIDAENNKSVMSTIYRVVKRNNELIIEPISTSQQVVQIRTEQVQIHEVDLTNVQSGWMDATKISGELHVKNLSEGCRMEPYGLKGSKLVSDILNEMKIPQQNRANYPLLFDQRGVVWIPGYRIAERVKIDRDVTTVVIRAYLHE
jgi:tRNA(Ile)-lysidine synthase